MKIEAFNEDIWAILPSVLARMIAAVYATSQIMGQRKEPSDPTIEAFLVPLDIEAAVRPNPRAAGAVGILPLRGILQYRPGLLAALFGATSLERWGTEFKRMVADDSVKAIILDIDSPGGGVYGLQELAEDIYQARSRKPIVAVANTLAASAAYHLAASATEIVASPSAQVGSIGVRALHIDISKALEDMGIKPTIISAGRYKAEGSEIEPLSDEAKAAIQERVDAYYDAFVGAVARGRNRGKTAIRNGFGEGRIVGAKDAKTMGMVDRIGTLEETITRWGGSLQSTARAAGWLPDLSGLALEPAPTGRDRRRRRQRARERVG